MRTAGANETDYRLYQLRKASNCKLVVSSGFRSVSENRRVGGAKNSYHLKDMTRDVIIEPSCLYFKFALAELAKKFFNGVIVYKRHIHLDTREKPYYSLGVYK
jgi:uncharacterized protein YcbK (DUF882 family)